ncbi:DUF4365 domain-containing protein [Archangium primigenium]|uniref:DUF4365 domain-containing protein n=1 Tax=[Archangium] primigenium TaxID=2792470 RepID=UPI00195D3BED|nr:DUF4365 domain-containing protein [Archangium primigenium]MBM7115702.1 DUF4365 domain-containing protein [Archangium primigenium]
MAKRSQSQKIGARGHKWLISVIEEHPDWLSRELGEDYGVDIEAELTENGVRGEILKIQIKSAETVEQKDGFVRAMIERKYVEYAQACRYPVILVLVDLALKEAWYLWIQDWILKRRATDGELSRNQDSWIHWIPTADTIKSGLDFGLKSIARWQGETQLVLSLNDALRSAAGTHNRVAMSSIIELITSIAPAIADISVDAIADEAIQLGDRLKGTIEGNAIAEQLFALARKFGARLSLATVSSIVLRGESYSRAGLIALGILYDDYFEHMKSLNLPNHFIELEPRVAYYCAFREAHPEEKSANFFADPKDFKFAGLRYVQPDRPWDKYANRGPSALLDYLTSQRESNELRRPGVDRERWERQHSRWT